MTVTATAPRRLLRPMFKDADGSPRCGPTANLLGARPRVDITPTADGLVYGGKGGMSVTPDDPSRLPIHLRPIRLGGVGELPLYEIAIHALGVDLAYRADAKRPDKHGFVEPAATTQIEAYQAALAATRLNWREVP